MTCILCLIHEWKLSHPSAYLPTENPRLGSLCVQTLDISFSNAYASSKRRKGRGSILITRRISLLSPYFNFFNCYVISKRWIPWLILAQLLLCSFLGRYFFFYFSTCKSFIQIHVALQDFKQILTDIHRCT